MSGGADFVERVTRYYDALGEDEWTRLTKNVRGRVSLGVHRRFLRRFVAPGSRVLEVGAGPGRFTLERIAVIGCGGAGKTTLANALGRRLGLPVLHVDGFYWQQRPGIGRVESTPQQWRRIHEGMLGGERWVIDGMKLGVLQARLEAADTVVFLDLPAWRCLWGVLKRRLRYRGRMRPDIGVYDRITTEFVRWICSFRRTARPRILELLGECSCQVVVLHSHSEVRTFLRSLEPRGAAPVANVPRISGERCHARAIRTP